MTEDNELREEAERMLKSDEFRHYLNIAILSRELWWLPLSEVKEIWKRQNEMEIGAFQLAAAEAEAKFYQKLATVAGGDIANMMLQSDPEKAKIQQGQVFNNMLLDKCKLQGVI